MPVLDKGDATAVLLHSAAPGCDIQSMTDNQRIAVDKVVERCFLTKGPIFDVGSEKHYVPLALEVLGRQLRLPLGGTSAKLEKWVNNLDLKRSNQKQHPMFSVLRLSYDNLPSYKHRSIFLDVALCAPRQHDNTSASVNEVCKWLSMVYCEDVDVILEILEDFQRTGLVERWQGLASPFGMHELYSEFSKAEGAKEDKANKQLYLYHEDGRYVPAMMQMFPHHNFWPLKRVHLSNSGFTKLSSVELRYMVHVEVLKLDFCSELISLDLRCLKSLRSLELRGCFELQMEGLEDLRYLKFFRWNTCKFGNMVATDSPKTLEIVEIYGSKESKVSYVDSFGACVGLLELTLRSHPLLVAVPDLCKFHKLEKVDFSGCCKVTEVRGLEDLCHLRHLNLKNCKNLRHCHGLENLVKIETLNFEGCERLQPPEVWNLIRLFNLRSINIGGNCVVRALVLGSPQLERLEVMGCRNLRTVALSSDTVSWKVLNRLNEFRAGEPIESRQWTVDCRSGIERNSFEAYETLNLSNCHTLESLGSIGLLSSLKYLYLQNCRMLRTLPNLSDSPFLEVVDLSYCSVLEDLGDIGPLRALQNLRLRNCGSLRSLRGLCSPRLIKLELSGCSKLESLGNINPLRSLKYLYLRHCRMLRPLPNLNDSPFLEVVDLSYCCVSEDLGDMSLLRSLEYLHLRNCGSLRSLRGLCSPCLIKLELSGCSKLESLGDRNPLRLLEYLYLRNCGSLRSLRDICSPCLKVLDSSGCSKLENLGDLRSLRSLERLNLNECVSLMSLPSPSYSFFLEVVNVKGCVNFSLLSQITTSDLVSDVSKCRMLTKFVVKDELVSLPLDCSEDEDSEDEDEDEVEDDSEEDEEMAFPKVSRKLMLACESRSDSAISDSTSNEKVWENWEDWVKSGNISAQPHGKAESLELLRASGNVADILYQQRVFFGGLRFLRQRHYSFPASILSVMSTKCFVSCIHVRN